MTGTSHEGVCIFITLSRWNRLRSRNVSDNNCWENQNTHFMLCNL